VTVAAGTPSQERLLTIGAVTRRLQSEFPDISISKIRYLEDQGLVAPKRTKGGYRLFSEHDVEQLRTVLRLQRDDFLPLRIIRQELSSPTTRERTPRRPLGEAADEEPEVELEELCERAGITPELARELEGFGLVERRAAGKGFAETDVAVASVCGALARYGIGPRHLRTFRSSADREVGLLEALAAPSLRSRNPERRQRGIDDLQSLGELAQELSQLLFWRVLRGLASR
jgi:DNA-binding transcriptional MerR regulator